MNRAWAEINLNNIKHNVSELKRTIGPKVALMAVVKANAYGHGALRSAAAMKEAGVRDFAVASVDEAIELRKGGVDSPVLIFGGTVSRRVPDVVNHGFTQTIFDEDLAEALSSYCSRNGKTVAVHIKIDTGMSRLGLLPGDESIKTVLRVAGMPGIRVEGIYTHFAESDAPYRIYTERQLETFLEFCEKLRKNGLAIPVRHAANSAAAIRYPEARLDMVRCGISLYGLKPAEGMDMNGVTLRPAMEFKTRIASLKEFPAGTDISYGRKYTTERRSLIAVISAGYADGYPRGLSGKADVLVGGRRVPVAGMVCMDAFMVDLTAGGISSANVGDEAVLFGRQGEAVIEADELAAKLGTINYEIVTRLGKRVPRIYV